MSLKRWLDTSSNGQLRDTDEEAIDWVRIIPFVFLHLCCLAIFVVGWSPVAIAVAVFMYVARMFAITSFYHRYFSHKAFKTSRPVQFIFALLGASATQRGPLWWAAHHRHHHLHADTEKDIHTPKRGFMWSHMGWFMCEKHFSTQYHYVKDLQKYPELVWLDRYDLVIPALTALFLFGLGALLAYLAPGLGTDGLQMVVWGYVVSTVVLFHATFSINSLAHKFGSRSFPTKDDSRNNWLLALVTLGEGWHNNHHFAPGSARQGFRWWEVDISYYILKVLSWMGLVWELKPVPNKVHNHYKRNHD